MADSLPATKYYTNLGGVNLKASQYEMSTAQFLQLYNMDFDVPKALQKRPGSTFAVSVGTSGPISSIFEFQKLDGSSYLVCGSDTAMFYIAASNYTLLSPGWTNGQPTDMLTFVNKLWMANGQKWQWFDGVSYFPAGLPIESKSDLNDLTATLRSDYLFCGQQFQSTAGSYFLVNGATHQAFASGSTTFSRALYMAYSYLRKDGYAGPTDFQNTARNIVTTSPGNGVEFLTNTNLNNIGGFTVPSGYGITAISIWFAEDTVYNSGTLENIPGVGLLPTGALGWYDLHATKNFASITLKPGADVTRFWLYTTIPTTSLFLTTTFTGATCYATTFIPGSTFAAFDGVPGPGSAFNDMTFDFFSTYTPKYLEINQNTMFAAGFSNAPSVLRFSEVGQPEFYLPESSFETRTNDGDRIYAIHSFNNQLIIMKENSFHKLIGDNASNYQLVQVTAQYGCLSNKSVVQYDQKLLWLDKKGIVEYNGANNEIISDPVEPIFRRMNIESAKEKAVGVHFRDRNQMWWGIPLDSSTQNNFTVVYDYLVGAWTFFDGFNPSSFAIAKGQLSRPTTWRGDYSGYVHYTGASFTSDSGRAITCLIQPRFENVDGQNATTLWRRFFLDVATVSGATTPIGAKLYTNYDSSTIQGTFAIYQSQFQSRAEFGLLGKAASVELSHSSATLPLLINGFSWSQRALRNV